MLIQRHPHHIYTHTHTLNSHEPEENTSLRFFRVVVAELRNLSHTCADFNGPQHSREKKKSPTSSSNSSIFIFQLAQAGIWAGWEVCSLFRTLQDLSLNLLGHGAPGMYYIKYSTDVHTATLRNASLQVHWKKCRGRVSERIILALKVVI